MASASLKASAQTRTVEVSEFQLAQAKIYDKTQAVLSSETANNLTNTPQEVTITFKFTDTTISTWKHDIIQPPAVKSTFTSGIPLIVMGDKIEVSPAASYDTEWAKPLKIETVKSLPYTVIVPAKSKVIVNLVANQGHCDVPFSYKQTDKDASGKIIDTIVGSDGVFTGINAYYTFDAKMPVALA